MRPYLDHHLAILYSAPLPAERGLPLTARQLQTLRAVEKAALATEGGIPGLHSACGERTRTCLRTVPDLGFPLIDRPEQAIRRCLDEKIVGSTLEKSRGLLLDFLRRARFRFVRLYGGLKSREAVLSRIAAHRNEGTPLDLWDAVRFRLVVATLSDLDTAQLAVRRQFRIVRCRNYYARPRGGPLDTYRAIHLEIGISKHEFFELQILTDLRDAVGSIDHAFIHKRTVSFVSPEHRTWLQELSMTANILDVRRCGAPLARPKAA